jgi:hypothetical protein
MEECEAVNGVNLGTSLCVAAAFFGQLNNSAMRYPNAAANLDDRVNDAAFYHVINGLCAYGKHLGNLMSGVKLQFGFFRHTTG